MRQGSSQACYKLNLKLIITVDLVDEQHSCLGHNLSLCENKSTVSVMFQGCN